MNHKTIVKSWGNSQGIRLNKRILDAAKIALEDELQIEVSDNMIILRKIQKHRTFEERLAEFDGQIDICDFDWGEPLGKEMI